MRWLEKPAGVGAQVVATLVIVMLIVVLLLLILYPGAAKAGDLIARPDAPSPIAGQCAKNIAVRKGEALSPVVLSPRGLASCSGVLVPLSDYADLLVTEKWATAVAAQYAVDTKALEMDIEWYKKKLEEESKPPPFLERAGTQRWFGRLETLVTVGVVAVGLSAAYQYGSGGFK